MSERQIGQLSFTDELVVDAARANMTLQRVLGLVDWNAVDALLSGLRSGAMGAPGYPRKRAIQYSRDVDDGVERSRRTGYPAFAGYDGSL